MSQKERMANHIIPKTSSKIELPLKHAMQLNDKAVKILASSIYKNLRSEGCQHSDIISVSSQLISLVTSSLNQPELSKKL